MEVELEDLGVRHVITAMLSAVDGSSVRRSVPLGLCEGLLDCALGEFLEIEADGLSMVRVDRWTGRRHAVKPVTRRGSLETRLDAALEEIRTHPAFRPLESALDERGWPRKEGEAVSVYERLGAYPGLVMPPVLRPFLVDLPGPGVQRGAA